MRVFSSLILIPHSYYFKNHLVGVGVGVGGRPRETIWLKAFGLPVTLTLELASLKCLRERQATYACQ